MIEDHRHNEDGSVIVVHETEPEVSPAEAIAEADVEVARIQAERDIALAKIAAKTVEPDLEAQLAAALAELDALKALTAPPAPEPVPAVEVPVIIDQDPAPDLDSGQEMPPADRSEVESGPPKKKIGLGMW